MQIVAGVLFALGIIWADNLLAQIWGLVSPRAATPKFVRAIGRDPEGPVTIYVPGVLARGQDQLSTAKGHRSVLDALTDWSSEVLLLNYAKQIFDPDLVKEILAMKIMAEAEKRPVVVIGASLGGCLASEVLVSLGGKQQKNKISLILLDAPAGKETLPAWNVILAKVVRFIPVFRGLILGFLPFPVAESGLPRNEEIQKGLPVDEVRTVAKRGLKGYTLRVLIEQLIYLVAFVPPWPTKLKAVTYISCEKGNVTVLQPQAKNIWRYWGIDTQVVVVQTPHVATVQRPQAFIRVLADLFKDLRACI